MPRGAPLAKRRLPVNGAAGRRGKTYYQ